MPVQKAEASQISGSEVKVLGNFGDNNDGHNHKYGYGDGDAEMSLVETAWQDMPYYEAFRQPSHLEKQFTAETNDGTEAMHLDSQDTGLVHTAKSVDAAESGLVYTFEEDHSSSTKNQCISLFALDLLNNLPFDTAKWIDDGSIDILCQALPQLLKTFAMKIGSCGTNQKYMDLMVFVHIYNREITKRVKDIYIDYRKRSRKSSPAVDNLDISNMALNEMDDALDSHYDDDLDLINRVVSYRDYSSVEHMYLLGLPAYQWLLQNIQRALSMDVPGNVQIKIRKSILQHLPSPPRIDSREIPQRHKFEFIVDWDPCLFLRMQSYGNRPEEAIEHVITITGTETDAQAMIAKQYLCQTWPSSGIHLLDLLKVVVQDTCILPYSCEFPDGTHLTVLSRGPRFTLQVIGISESIVEIGEQLTWLASTLRSSSSPCSSYCATGVALVEALVRSEQLDKGTEESNGKFLCDISFVESPVATSKTAQGQYWHRLFSDPVVAQGYPIPRRPAHHRGLEINKDLMLRLTGANGLFIFAKKIVIKSRTPMILIRPLDNIYLWHVRRATFYRGPRYNSQGTDTSKVKNGRHILGWSSEDVRASHGFIGKMESRTEDEEKRIMERMEKKRMERKEKRRMKTDTRWPATSPLAKLPNE